VVSRQNFPLTIAPGERKSIELCSTGLVDSVLVARLKILGECVDRDVAIIPFVQRIDTTAPRITRPDLQCSDEVVLTFTDEFGSGIVEFRVDTLINCTAELDPAQASLPSGIVSARIRRIDYRKDMIYQVGISDRAGNTIVERDTLGGFTIDVFDVVDGLALGPDPEKTLEGEMLDVRHRRCDSLTLANHGTQPLVIGGIALKGNVTYSVPPSQFPVTIPPRSTVKVGICIDGARAGSFVDTAYVLDQCLHRDTVPVKVVVAGLTGGGTDACNNAISIEQYGASKRTFITTPIPNPASGALATVDLGLDRDDVVAIQLYSADGTPVADIMRGVALSAGISRIGFDISSLESGAYFLQLRTASGTVQVQKFMVSR
jgi:hypothetical protein